MRLNRRAVIAAALSLSTLVATTAWAHVAPRVETAVEWEQSDGGLAVTHILQLNPTQRLLYKGDIIAAPDLESLRARAKLALYVSENFALTADGEAVQLDIVGAEIDGEHVYVYQSGQLDTLPKQWTVRNSTLRDLKRTFHNTTNLPTQSGIQSLVFDDYEIDTTKSTTPVG